MPGRLRRIQTDMVSEKANLDFNSATVYDSLSVIGKFYTTDVSWVTGKNIDMNNLTVTNTLNVSTFVVAGNVTIQGNLSALGETTYLNTDVVTLSTMRINNITPGPALFVNQEGNETVLDIRNNNFPVLLLSGGRLDISSSGNSNQWWSTTTTVSSISGWKRTDTTTDAAGAIGVGSTIQLGTDPIAILEQILYSYKIPNFSFFQMNFSEGNMSAVLDLGQVIAAGSRTATWGYGTLGNLDWNTNSIGIHRDGTLIARDISYATQLVSIAHPAYTNNSPTTVTFSLTGGHTRRTPAVTTLTNSYHWRHRIWFGKSPLTSLANFSNFSSFNSVFTNTNNSFGSNTFSFNSSINPEYPYIITPVNPGSIASTYNTFKDTSTNLDWPFLPSTQLTVTGLNGISITYNVYRSTNPTAAAVNILAS